MRNALCVALFALFSAAPGRADAATKDRLSRYFGGWFALCPATSISVVEATDILVPGYEAYRVERHCQMKNRNELSITLVDAPRNELFIGEVFYSDERRDKTFVPAADIPTLEAAIQDAFGLPASVRVEAGARGSLIPLRASIREAPDAVASMPGFVSQDGAAFLLGEFHPFDVPPERWREKVLAESPGVRTGKGSFFVTAFIDFQCEKCRQRTPQVREVVATLGGALEIRLLPLVKVHNWAFAAAESAAALAEVSPALYTRYEESIFPRAGSMNGKAARDLAADVADAAGVREAFEAEISSGRARQHVVRDIELAMRLGLNGTPVFFDQGVYLTSDPGLAESTIQSRHGSTGAKDKGVLR